MLLSKLKEQYKEKKISKESFINSAFEVHRALFDYSHELRNVDIESILINEKGVTFITKRDQIKFWSDKVDKRIAPIETLNFDEYELSEQKFLLGLIKDGDTVFDIGANIGWYSLSAAARFKNSTIHAFEPLPQIFKVLKLNIEINDSKSIFANQIGLSNEQKEVTFYYDESFCTKSSQENLGETNATKVICKLETLDDYVVKNNVKKIDVIKCDIEGAELFAFQGGLKSIKKFKPLIFSEMLRKWAEKFDYHPNDIINFLGRLGYECYGINEDKLERVSNVTENTIATNYIFFNENHRELLESVI